MAGDFTFLKGNIETIILCSLYNKDMYGYELAKSIKDRTQSQYEIKQPTLYSYLKRLEQDGYVYAYWGGESSGGRRRYYKLTEQGRADCEKFLAEWEYQRNVMGSLVDGTADVAPVGDGSKLLGRKSPRKRKVVRTFDEQDEIAQIDACIVCDKDTHKAIILGRQGQMIKKIGHNARVSIQKMLQKKVVLNLFVKVKPNWKNNLEFLSSLGYNINEI